MRLIVEVTAMPPRPTITKTTRYMNWKANPWNAPKRTAGSSSEMPPWSVNDQIAAITAAEQ